MHLWEITGIPDNHDDKNGIISLKVKDLSPIEYLTQALKAA